MVKENPALRVAAPVEAPQDAAVRVTKLDLAPAGAKRHGAMVATFLLGVVLPTIVSLVYLFGVAVDQYHSKASFSVRSEEFTSPLAALSAFTDAGTSAVSDGAILYDFVRSQTVVERLDERLDLREMFSRHPSDIVFALSESASIDDLVNYWRRMVSVSVDSGSAIVDIEVRAFSPEDARVISQAVVEESGRVVNELSQIARNDAIRFADEELLTAAARLRDIRRQIREFRAQYQIIDPEADAESQIGVVSELQSRLADLLVSRGGLQEYADEGDPRLQTLDRQIRAIRNQISLEREAVADSRDERGSLSEIIGKYEELLVDLEFSEHAYTAAMASVEQARAEARRQSRYAAVHIPPTLPEESLYPRRLLLVFVVFICALCAWAVGILVYYNVRERS